jgi:hypothetical protein
MFINIKKLFRYHEVFTTHSNSIKCGEIATFFKKKGNVALGSSFETCNRTAACYRNDKNEIVFVALFCVFGIGNYLFGLTTNLVAKSSHLNNCVKRFYDDMA